MKLFCIRGLPGSGKTTIAKSMEDVFHVEADMYFTHMDGTYTFDGKQIGKAHDWCQKQAAKALENGCDVVVSNTFTQKWEITPYLRMAQALNAEFIVIKALGTYENTHNVPQEALDKMKTRWEDWPGEFQGTYEWQLHNLV